MSKELQKIVSDNEINKAFEGSSFGDQSNRNVLKYGLLKVATKYWNGNTIEHIMWSLKLINIKHKRDPKLTDKGREYLINAF